MSWSDRRAVLAGLCALGSLSACGFSPAYAPGEVGEQLRGQILAAAPTNRQGFYFVDRIENRLGRNDSAPYQLNYSWKLRFDGLAVTPDNATYRYHMIGELDYQVVDRETGETLTSDSVREFVAYSALGTTVATRASQTDAEERLMVILADRVVTRLYGTAETWLP